MRRYAFETVDVFTDRRFGGNPLAVFPQAQGLNDADMQAIAREFNLSETTFVLPPRDPAHTAVVRIFTPATELDFAGHPNVGTALVLALRMQPRPERLLFEERAGRVPIAFDWSDPPLATIEAPKPLSRGADLPPDLVAASVGLSVDQLVVTAHAPCIAGMGTDFVLAEVTAEGLAAAAPNIAIMREAAIRFPVRPTGFPVHIYVRDGAALRTRMFSPLSGIPEDPATGSANLALAGLLLTLDDVAMFSLTIQQGVEMGRPSLLHARAWRDGPAVHASIAGGAVSVLSGYLDL